MELEKKSEKLERATFGGGCFWCVEAIFENIKGVEDVISGYSGGLVKNPSYMEVCNGTTGHAEVVQIFYKPSVVSYEELLEVFFKTHNPTTLNQQGADKGTQYRSVIFFHNDQQKEVAERFIERLDASGAFSQPIVTELSPLINFYKAEEHHQDYYQKNPNLPYCAIVINPKLLKVNQQFPEKLK
jgi:peptide-methionine (S)-S-oxide reductase